MGRWRYLNWLVILVILFFMFYALASRYQASVATYLSVIPAMVMLTLTGYYIFIIKIERKEMPDKSANQKPEPAVIPKERPKVVLNRVNNHKENKNEE